MALAVARLHELGIVHHDIKPQNTMIGKAGVRIIDFGTACVGVSDAVVNAAAAHASPFVSTEAPPLPRANRGRQQPQPQVKIEEGCHRVACSIRSYGGTAGYQSPFKVAAFDELSCAKRIACTAAELHDVDLFAIGATLL